MLASVLVMACWVPASFARQGIERVSVNSAGVEGNHYSTHGDTCADGTLVVFRSIASNLVPGDTNGTTDVFLRNRLLGTTIRVNVDDQGQQANNITYPPSIASRGRFVGFASFASNLVPGDTNNAVDVFRRDLLLSKTIRVSLASSGAEGNGSSWQPSLSNDGRLVAFMSDASNLVPGDTNGWYDVFVRDTQLGITERISVDSSGLQANERSQYPTLSGDGMLCAFVSSASNLDAAHPPLASSNIYLRNRVTGTTSMAVLTLSGLSPSMGASSPRLSDNGRFMGFSSETSDLVLGDQNGTVDVFVLELSGGTIERVSVGPGGIEANGGSTVSSISADGRFLAFNSSSTNLVPGGDFNGFIDTYHHDRDTGETRLMSLSHAGQLVNEDCRAGGISDDGRFVAFDSLSANLVPGDTNGLDDVFLADVTGGTITAYCTAKPNSLGCLPTMHTWGFPSAAASSGFVLHCENVRNQKVGLLLYSLTGQAATPFQGGFLCVKAPIRRTVPINSGGSPAGTPDCSGHWSLDFCAFASGQLGGNPEPALLQPGTLVQTQWWGRDPGFPPPFNVALSAAIEFSMVP